MATPNTTIPPAHAEMLPDTATVAGRVEMSQHELAREMKRDRDLLITKARFLARVLNETSDRLATNSDYIPLSHG
ncbi:MAG: hypothetical protein HY292_07795, partial [Planctomycetes bacterium]|nr:hypothetical protein [Planctomycetota bacterium]